MHRVSRIPHLPLVDSAADDIAFPKLVRTNSRQSTSDTDVDHQLFVVAHLLAAGYWLGTDLAVYHISGAIADGRRPAVVRSFAAHIMLLLDMVPRTTLILTFALGFTLAIRLGLMPTAAAWLPWLWALALAWLALTWAVFRNERTPLGAALARIDFGLRVLILAGCLWLAVDAHLAGGLVVQAPWLGAKLAILGVLIGLGLIIRIQLKPFGALLARSLSDQATEADHAAVARLIAQVKVPVWLIWIGVVAAMVLGRLKPG
jgi:hypothetical protein